jgi:hypothetical protein
MKTIVKLFTIIFAVIASFSYNLTASVTGANYTDVDRLLGIPDDTDYENPTTTLMGVVQQLKQPTVDARKVLTAVQTAQKNIDVQKERENLYRSVTPRQAFLVGKKKDLTQDAKSFIENGTGEFREGIIYFLHEFSAALSGNNPIIKSGDKVGPGFSTLLQNGVVPAEKSLAVDFISIDHIANAAAGTFLFSAFKDLKTAAIMALAADFEFRVDGVIVATIPGHMFNEVRIQKNIHTRSSVGNGFNLEKPIILRGGSVVYVSLNYPEGISEALPGAGGSNVFRVNMLGSEISAR